MREKIERPQPSFIVLKVRCEMCKAEFILWSGTKREWKKFDRNRKSLASIVKRSRPNDD